MQKLKHLKNTPNFSGSAKIILVGMLITNIGNGIFTLTVGKILYEKTGSPVAFGGVIIIDYLINFLLQMIAGSFVDRNNPKKICVWADLLRGVTLCLSSIFLYLQGSIIWLIIAILIINIAKPFYRSAVFSIGPLLCIGNQLIKFNSFYAICLQIGQLVGIALAGILLKVYGNYFSLTINGLSYLLCGAAIIVARIPTPYSKDKGIYTPRKFLMDWVEIKNLILKNKTILYVILLASGDLIAVSLINLALVPIVNIRFNANTYWLSAFDGCFAVGSIVSASKVTSIIDKMGKTTIIVLGAGIQGILFLIIILLKSPYLISLTMIFMGIANTISVTVFITSIQLKSNMKTKGRIASLRHLTLSVFASVLIPLASYGYKLSLTYGLLISSLVCFGYCLAIIIIQKFCCQKSILDS